MDEQQKEKRSGAVDSLSNAYYGISNVWRVAKTVRFTGVATQVGGAVISTPAGWIALGIGILVFILIVFFFSGGSGMGAPFPGGGSDQQERASVPGTGGQATQGLNYHIAFRDPTVTPLDIRSEILRNWPNAQTQNWNTIISEAVANGWNPAFLLALWIEESGAQGVPAADPLGCDPNHPTNNINASLNCVFKSFKEYTNDRFADFMCRYGGDNFSDAPCTFNIANPNFPKNVRFWYEKLVPQGSPGALIEATPPGQASLSATCPIQGGTAKSVTCGSFFTLRSSCGHCREDAGYASFMSLCTYEAINYAEDIGGAAGQDVILPSINNSVVDWSLVQISQSSVGAIRYFAGINKQTNEEYWIQFHHVDANYGAVIGKSGDVGARICTSSIDCNHVHVEFSTITPGGGKKSQDTPLFLCI